MLVDVYHSGRDRPRAPFLLVASKSTAPLPDHPDGKQGRWTFWKAEPLVEIAVEPRRAGTAIKQDGFFIQ